MKLEISLSGSLVPGGVYSSVKIIGTAIYKWKSLLNKMSHLNPDTDETHCTVLYSRNKDNASGNTKSERVYAANIKEFTSWIGHDGKRYLVALLESPSLQTAFKEWRDLGYTSDYPDYKPHITIQKGLNEVQCLEAIDIMTTAYFTNPFIITFGEQKVAPLRD